jgi:hypothetical protein
MPECLQPSRYGAWHRITGNDLFGLSIRTVVCRFIGAATRRVRVGIYHKLPRAKAQQQHPGKDYMVFIFFHAAGQLYSLTQK